MWDVGLTELMRDDGWEEMRSSQIYAVVVQANRTNDAGD